MGERHALYQIDLPLFQPIAYYLKIKGGKACGDGLVALSLHSANERKADRTLT